MPLAYVTNGIDHTVSVIDTSSNTVVANIDPVAGVTFTEGIVFTPNGLFAYVTSVYMVVVVDTTSHSVVDLIAVPSRPRDVTITPDGRLVYATADLSSQVSIIETATNTLVATVDVGDRPLDVAMTPPPIFVCVGFEPPMEDGPVSVNKNRALPLKAELFDGDGLPVTDVDLEFPPVIQVTFTSGTLPSVDVSDQSVPVGLGTDGIEFEFADGKWRYNLKTKNFTALGTYTITMAPGNNYRIDPTCASAFVIE